MGMVRFWEDPSLSWWRDGRLPDGPLPGSGGEREEGGREREREEGGRDGGRGKPTQLSHQLDCQSTAFFMRLIKRTFHCKSTMRQFF